MDITNFIKTNIFYIICGIGFILLNFFYIKLNLHKDDRFRGLVNTYASFGILLTIYNIYINGQINYANIIDTELNNLNSLFINITQACSLFFINNPKMMYYYNELFNNITNTDNTIRDNSLEQIISNNILMNIDALINYIDSYKISKGISFQLELMDKKLLNLLKQFTKSPIFVENWNIFKNQLALDWTKTYMNLYFNL